MNLKKLSKLQLWGSVALISLVILGLYTYFRFIPLYNHVALLTEELQKTEKRLKKAKVPSAPRENLDEVTAQLNDQEQALEFIKASAEGMSVRLASFDSQELKVRISQLARDHLVRIKANEAFNQTFQKANLSQVKKKKKKKKAKATNAVEGDLILPAFRGWIDRMSPGTMFYRPMQHLKLEGSFHNLRKFIHGLDSLPWQVTVVKLSIEKAPIEAPVGFPQTLSAELVLAL
jgi:hypothetical protein